MFGNIPKGEKMPPLTDYDKFITRYTVVGLALILGFFAFFTYTVENRTKAKLQAENLSLIDRVTELESENADLRMVVEFLETSDIPHDLNIQKLTRGVRNKNPMNIVALSSKNPWLGQLGRDNQYHAIFQTYEHGLRAGYITLKNYYEKKNIRTLHGITSRFCEGDAVRYAKFIGDQLGGISPYEEIDVMKYMPEIMKAMVRYENGFDIFPDRYYIPYTKP